MWITLIKSFVVSQWMNLLPVVEFVKNNWKLCLVLASLSLNVYYYLRLDSVKSDRKVKDTVIEQKTNKISELQLVIQNQNLTIEDLNKVLEDLESDKVKTQKEVDKLGKKLKETIKEFNDEKIDDECEAKIEYLREGVKDLKW